MAKTTGLARSKDRTSFPLPEPPEPCYCKPEESNTRRNRELLQKHGFKFVGGWLWRLGPICMSEGAATGMHHNWFRYYVDIQLEKWKQTRGSTVKAQDPVTDF